MRLASDTPAALPPAQPNRSSRLGGSNLPKLLQRDTHDAASHTFSGRPPCHRRKRTQCC